MEYENILLLRLGEIALKGLNRRKFETQLFRNLRARLRPLGKYRIEQSDSRVWIRAEEGTLATEATIEAITDVFGFVSVSPVRCFALDVEMLSRQCLDYARQVFADGQPRSFKIEAKRVNKAFPLSSYELCCHLGDLICESFPELATVKVKQPDLTLYVEIREAIYLYHEIIASQKGLPVGMSGKGMLLLSGGIDSPVAGYRMASRGMQLECCYFHSFPYTSDEAKEKVIQLARILSRYAGRISLHVVDFTEIQLCLNEHCPEEMGTIVMRRMMLRIAAALARKRGVKSLITGESLGQVASQTLEGLVCTDEVADMPIFRPLIGCDKDETTALARKIGSFETSILPYEDCCTIFVAKHPKTHPSLDDARRAESSLDVDQLTEMGVQAVETLEIFC